MNKPKQYCLKQPITFAFDDETNANVVLRTASNGLLFMSPERFLADFEELKDDR